MTKDLSRVLVTDPFGAAADVELPGVASALDPAQARAEFKHGLPRLAGLDGRVSVRAIRVLRHKPGKRCVIEYDVRVKPPEPASRARALLIGKIRARRFGNEGFRLQDSLWRAGFQEDSADGVSVPEPVAVVPRFKMWLQRKVPGADPSELLAGPQGPGLARRIAEALCKLHQAGVPAERAHRMADELRILHECLTRVAAAQPRLAGRLVRILAASVRLGVGVPEPAACGIHRDFYPAQALVDGSRIWLLDFDLYCQGDPALDVGNFLGHVIEENARLGRDARATTAVEQAMEERFLELTETSSRLAVRAYTHLTLVRHIYLSTLFPDRSKSTEALVERCEERLAGAGAL